MSSFDTNTYNKPRSADNKYTMIIIGVLVLVIICLIVFGGGDSKNDTKALEDEIEKLMEDSHAHIKTKDSLLLKVEDYKKITAEFRTKDSLNAIAIAQQEEITHQLRIQQAIAQRERKEAERKLEDFKNNPPKHDLNNPYNLLIDTERRINKNKDSLN
jgi:hypothetical protein